MKLNLNRRIVSYWFMFFHGMRELLRGDIHIQAWETCGHRIGGVYIGYRFVDRYCYTCGYRPFPKERR